MCDASSAVGSTCNRYANACVHVGVKRMKPHADATRRRTCEIHVLAACAAPTRACIAVERMRRHHEATAMSHVRAMPMPTPRRWRTWDERRVYVRAIAWRTCPSHAAIGMRPQFANNLGTVSGYACCDPTLMLGQSARARCARVHANVPCELVSLTRADAMEASKCRRTRADASNCPGADPSTQPPHAIGAPSDRSRASWAPEQLC